jgi:hypothetical protein
VSKSITIKVENLDRVLSEIARFGTNVQAEVGSAVQGQALTMISNVKRQIERGPKTGRIYKRGRVTHRASAPYEPPANDRGALASSLYYRQDGPYTATIGSKLPYAYYLEYGYFKGGKPRPTWALEAFSAQQALTVRINQILERAAK